MWLVESSKTWKEKKAYLYILSPIKKSKKILVAISTLNKQLGFKIVGQAG